MKKLILIVIILPLIYSAQVDRFKLTFDLSLGYTKHYFDNIINPIGYQTNYTFSTYVYENNFQHQITNIHSINSVLNFGLHIPIYKNDYLGIGLRPKVGFGYLTQIKPKKIDSQNDKLPIVNSSILNSEISIYFLYDFSNRHSNNGSLILSGGVRYYQLSENYFTPVINVDYCYKNFSIGYYFNFYRFYSYRNFSDGSREVAKIFKDYGGIKFQYLVNIKKKKKATQQVTTKS